MRWKPFRQQALGQGRGMDRRTIGNGSDGLGAIFPAMLNALIALKTLHYPTIIRFM
jgi:squalene-hopene/tetraprenyl-beta-curcumene cyclase